MKQVPEVSELGFDPVTRRLKREGVPLQINPFDRRAVLEATRLRQEVGGTVTVVSMGPPQTADALRECLSLGIDRAVHLSDRAFAGADTLATARALARAIERIGFDLVLGGRFTIDSETGQVGPEVAALLDVPLVSGVRRLTLVPDEQGAGQRWLARAECERDDGYVEVECATPLLITCTDRWKTRVPLVMPDEEAGQTRPLEVWTAADLGGSPDDYGQTGSPTWVAELQAVASERRNQRIVAGAGAGFDAAVDAVVAELAAMRADGARVARGRTLAHRGLATADGAVWVLAELAPDRRLRSVSAELLGAADVLAEKLGVGVAVFAIAPELGPGAGTCDVAALARELGALGTDVLLSSTTAAASEEESARQLEAAIVRHRPRIVLAPATGLGRDLVPRVAARLGLGLTGDAIGVELDGEGRLRQLKPAFGGQLVAPILSRTRPEMVTIRPGVLDPARAALDRPAARIEALPAVVSGPVRTRTLGWTAELGDGPSLDDARIVVCVGWGLGRDSVPLATELASALGGVVGATRRVCDGGWLPRQLQIGISGRSVAPDLYLALGVRGSFNHVVGMRRSGRVIAVNRDEKAEVFAAADVGVVGDARGFVEALLGRVRA